MKREYWFAWSAKMAEHRDLCAGLKPEPIRIAKLDDGRELQYTHCADTEDRCKTAWGDDVILGHGVIHSINGVLQ